MENTIWTLVPPLMAIIMVLLTKRVLLSLGVGIVTAAFFVSNFNFMGTLVLTFEAFKQVFISDGVVNMWTINILSFALMLGILTATVSMMGGTLAFAEWMSKRVKTRIGAQIMTLLAGFIIFVDDGFSSLTVGPIARPVTDKHRISRAKLAYLVDSTAAPVSVIAPISSWGAYIIGLLGSVMLAQGLTQYSAFSAYLQIIPMNFYVWATIGVALVVILSKTEFGPMKVHEDRAIETGELLDPNTKDSVDRVSSLPVSSIGKISDLAIPIGVVFLVAMFFIYWTGLQGLEGEKSIINIFGNADVSKALFYGGLFGVTITLVLFSRHFLKGKLNGKQLRMSAFVGVKTMLPTTLVLIFAWTISFLIGALKTGEYLGSVIEGANISITLLPVIIFSMACLLSISTGTSWGSFAILLPIAGQIAASTDVTLLLPMFAAVIAGSIFGDHCSPISDTTILSSVGASCHHIDHVVTQLPYALVAALVAGLGYIVLGVTGNVWFGLAMILVGLMTLFVLLKRRSKVTEVAEVLFE